jgi:hypothetical protein
VKASKWIFDRLVRKIGKRRLLDKGGTDKVTYNRPSWAIEAHTTLLRDGLLGWTICLSDPRPDAARTTARTGWKSYSANGRWPAEGNTLEMLEQDIANTFEHIGIEDLYEVNPREKK